MTPNWLSHWCNSTWTEKGTYWALHAWIFDCLVRLANVHHMTRWISIKKVAREREQRGWAYLSPT